MIAIVLALAVGAASVPLGQRDIRRTYVPSEFEDQYRIEYLPWIDDDGKLHNDSLREPPVKSTAVPADVVFYLYTRSNPTDGHTINGTDFGEVANSPFDPSKKSLFISHGWRNDYTSSVNTNIRPAALSAADINVFVVDWSTHSKKFYTSAKGAVPSVGEIEGSFINYLIDTYQLAPYDFYLVGHSLGAHVAGCAGDAVQQAKGSVASIVGLDPAGPLYLLNTNDTMIDADDADVVHIIHTNGILLGLMSSIGDADFYPNGGALQPGCSLDITGKCSHGRSYEYYAESLLSGGFGALACDSHSSFTNGECDGNHRSFMGGLIVDREAQGDYYLDTSDSQPFSLDTSGT